MWPTFCWRHIQMWVKWIHWQSIRLPKKYIDLFASWLHSLVERGKLVFSMVVVKTGNTSDSASSRRRTSCSYQSDLRWYSSSLIPILPYMAQKGFAYPVCLSSRLFRPIISRRTTVIFFSQSQDSRVSLWHPPILHKSLSHTFLSLSLQGPRQLGLSHALPQPLKSLLLQISGSACLGLSLLLHCWWTSSSLVLPSLPSSVHYFPTA